MFFSAQFGQRNICMSFTEQNREFKHFSWTKFVHPTQSVHLKSFGPISDPFQWVLMQKLTENSAPTESRTVRIISETNLHWNNYSIKFIKFSLTLLNPYWRESKTNELSHVFNVENSYEINLVGLSSNFFGLFSMRIFFKISYILNVWKWCSNQHKHASPMPSCVTQNQSDHNI